MNHLLSNAPGCQAAGIGTFALTFSSPRPSLSLREVNTASAGSVEPVRYDTAKFILPFPWVEGRGEEDSQCIASGVKSNAIGAILAALLFSCAAASGETFGTNLVSGLPVAATSLPDTGASVLRVLGALLLVIAIFFGGVWLFRNWQRVAAKKYGGTKLNLLEVKSLGQRQAIYVVGYQQQRMLLASSPTGVTLVSHLPDADAVEAAAPAPKMNFAEAFQQVLSRSK